MMRSMQIKIKRGLNIPIGGTPSGTVQTLPQPTTLALDLDAFPFLRFSLLKKVGEAVTIGEPLAEDKSCPGRVFVSPASGTIKDIVRGLKRRILHIVIACDSSPKYFEHALPKELLPALMQGGLFPHIRVRPCNRLPDPSTPPEAIFVRAIASAPFAPPPELEVQGKESFFQHALTALSTLCPVHLVSHAQSTCAAFREAKDVETHTAEGPHPISHPSLHIAAIHPIRTNQQTVWTLDVSDVVAIGSLLKEGRYDNQRVVSLAGEGMAESKRGFFRIPRGFPVTELSRGCCDDATHRLISGDPLTGTQVTCGTFLKFFDSVFCALPLPESCRRFAHFLRFQTSSYTQTGAYLKKKKPFSFTTLQHGEERAFVDGAVYDKVMPLNLPVMHLIKAVLAEDFELAESLGLLSVAPEDFALPAFVCPSKIEMPEIIRQGLQAYAEQYLS